MNSLPPFPSHIGNRGRIEEGDGTLAEFTIVDEIARLQMRYASGGQVPRKMLVLQRIQFDSGMPEIRTGYYLLSSRPSGEPRWVWARFTLLAPLDDFAEMVEEARSKGWFA
jgi:hypothetical protein